MPDMFESGFFHREPAWHGKGVVTDTPPETFAQARTLMGAEWDPEPLPVKGRGLVPSGIGPDGEPVYEWDRDIPGWVEIIRPDTGATLYIGPETYELITITDMGDIVDVIMGDSRYHFETGGLLEGGRKIWILVELGDPIVIPGDPSPTKRFIAFLNSFDGQTSFKAIATMIRIVCANTWKAAEVDGAKSESCYTFQHTRHWRRRLDAIAEEAQQAMRGAAAHVEAYREEAERMLSLKVHRDQERAFLRDFISPSCNDYKLGKRALANVEEAREQLAALYASPTCEGITGTAYGLMQAGGEFADWVRPAESPDTLFGRSVARVETWRKRAHSMALAAAAGKLD
jgi:phage/plasmid-like protein (TIGR03299 family)